jgi:hypothetical protein
LDSDWADFSTCITFAIGDGFVLAGNVLTAFRRVACASVKEWQQVAGAHRECHNSDEQEGERAYKS